MMNVTRTVSLGLWLALSILGGFGTPGVYAGSAGIVARTWDQEITLSAGGYRAGKPIQMDGSFNVIVEAGTYIEGVDFEGKEHDQKFKIEGALLRKSKFIGQLGFQVAAKDSAFDECTLHRTGGWFVDMWGSRWKFENCVINKDFLLPEIDVANYSIHAVRTTFIGVKMPAIKYKNDPSKYLQKQDLIFEKCRFIQCDIPETLLAACVDCAFENCQFPSKKSDWSGATEPIKVTASIAGGGHLPQPYLNGKLSVQFVAAPSTIEAGSTLAYSASGGRITLNTVRIPQQFVMLGTTEKKASEIPDFGGVPKTAAGVAPAPSAPLLVTEAEIRSLDDVMKAIPPTAELVANGAINPTAVEAANTQLQQSLGGKSVALRPLIDDIRATQENGFAYKATAREVPMIYRGLTIPVGMAFLFRPADAAPLGKVMKGSSVGLRGTIVKAELQGRGRGLAMVITMGDGKVP